MAQSSNAVPFDSDDEMDDSSAADNTCPDCGMDSVVPYIDRYSSYEYCTNCEWSDEEDANTSSREPIRRSDRGRDEN